MSVHHLTQLHHLIQGIARNAPTWLILFAVTALADNSCPSDRIIGEGRGKRQDIADANADMAIAISINSGLKAKVTVTLDKVTIDGIPADSSTYSSKAEIHAELIKGAAVKQLSRSVEDGEHVSIRFICRSDAAIPYLDSLRIYLRTKLNAFEHQLPDSAKCANAGNIYAKMLGWQRILEDLRQMDKALQKKYEKIDGKIKKDCHQTTRKGVYVEIKGTRAETISDKLNELLSNNNCRVEQEPKSNAITLKIDAKDCNQKNDGYFDHCSSCAKVDIINGNTKIPLGNITAKGSWEGKEAACEESAKKVAPEIWGKIKSHIKEVCE